MSKHTPGPWHVGGLHKCTIYDKFGNRIANSFEGGMASQLTDSECAANARLIAVSPTMFDYMIARSALGDAEASAILESINAAR